MGKETALPKNIRQIGDIQGKEKICIEDYVMTYIHKKEPQEEKGFLGIFLGEKQPAEDAEYTFVRGILEISQEEEEEKLRERFEKERAGYFPGWEVMGCCVIGVYPTKRLEQLMAMVPEAEQMIYHLQEQEETIYLKDQGSYRKMKGYLVFYEQNQKMQDYLAEIYGEDSVEKESTPDKAIKSFRQKIKEKGEQRSHSLLKLASSFFVITVLAIGAIVVNRIDEIRTVSSDGIQNKTVSDGTGGQGTATVAQYTAQNTSSAGGTAGQDAAPAGESTAQSATSAGGSTVQSAASAGESTAQSGTSVGGAAVQDAASAGAAAVQDTASAGGGAVQDATSAGAAVQDAVSAGGGAVQDATSAGAAVQDAVSAGGSAAQSAASAGGNIAQDTASSGGTTVQGTASTGGSTAQDVSDGTAAAQSAAADDGGSSWLAGSDSFWEDTAAEDEPETETDASAAEAGNASAQGGAQPETSEAVSRQTQAAYVIKAGDTLANICKKYYGSMERLEEICEANNITDANLILPGQKIVLP